MLNWLVLSKIFFSFSLFLSLSLLYFFLGECVVQNVNDMERVPD